MPECLAGVISPAVAASIGSRSVPAASNAVCNQEITGTLCVPKTASAFLVLDKVHRQSLGSGQKGEALGWGDTGVATRLAAPAQSRPHLGIWGARHGRTRPGPLANPCLPALPRLWRAISRKMVAPDLSPGPPGGYSDNKRQEDTSPPYPVSRR